MLSRCITAGALVPVICRARAPLIAARLAQDHARQFGRPARNAFFPPVAQALAALASFSHISLYGIKKAGTRYQIPAGARALPAGEATGGIADDAKRAGGELNP